MSQLSASGKIKLIHEIFWAVNSEQKKWSWNLKGLGRSHTNQVSFELMIYSFNPYFQCVRWHLAGSGSDR